MNIFLSEETHGDGMSGPESPRWAQMLENYLEEITVSEYTQKKYRREIGRTLKMLANAGLESDPSKIGKKEIAYLYRTWSREGIHPNYLIWRLNHLNLILRHYKNFVMSTMNLNLRPVERTKVRWFTPEQTELIWAAAEALGPQYEIRIHLGLDLLLRKIEMKRLKISDIDFDARPHGNIHVLGKGRNGGKPADLPFHPHTEYYMKKYLEWREDHGLGDQEYLLNEGMTTMDNRLLEIEKKMKEMFPDKAFHFSYHDLRRSGAAQYYWVYGWDLVEVQHMLRHEKLETTIQYLGLKYEIVQKALWVRETKTGPESPHNPPAIPSGIREINMRF